MNKLIVLFLFLTSCVSTFHGIDTSKFTFIDKTVFYNGKPMAEITNVEYSYDNKKIVKEITLRLIDYSLGDKVKYMLAYIHQKQPKWEIEVDIPIEDISFD